ncbi:MAG: hypothetical protein PHN88_08330 [Ignavibacteria bacterium]|nr:hypothetical protein [Ignavibacteria bacterium]
MNVNTANTDIVLNRIEDRIFGVYKKEIFQIFINRILITLIFFAVLLFVLTISEQIFGFTIKIRTGIFYTYIISFASAVLYFTALLFAGLSRNRFNPISYSEKVGRFFPAVKDKISNAISLYRNDSNKLYSSRALVTANLHKVGKDTEEIDLTSFISFAKTRNRIYILLSAITVISFLIFLTPLSNAFGRLIHFNRQYGNNLPMNSGNTSDDAFVKSFKVTIIYPGYTNLPPKDMEENNGDIVCIEGSTINFTVISTEEISEADIDFNGSISKMNIQGSTAQGTIKADKEGFYKFIIKNKEGKENINRKTYPVRLLKDEPPKITIINPGDNVYNIFGEKDVHLKAIITDDFGFSKLSLSFRKDGAITSASNGYTTINIPLVNLKATSLEVAYDWALQSAGLSQGARIEYFMEVTDNSGKSTRSDTRYIIYNTPAEYLKKTESTTKDIKSDLNSLSEDVKNLQQEIRDIRNNPDEHAVNEQRKKELQSKIENIQKNMDAVQNKIDQTLNDLKQNPVLSEKTLEQFMKLQELFKNINTPEFREMLKKLQESMKKNAEQFKQDLNNMKFDEEAFRKQLEQVMELMKKIENMQKMGELTQRLDEMTKKQDEIKKETEQTQKNSESKMNSLADKQKDNKEEFAKFKEDMKNLIDNMKNTKNEMDTKDLEKLLKKMKDRKTEDKMQKSSSDLFKGQKEQSEESQKEISEDMNEFNEDMQNSLENAMDNMDMNGKMKEKMKSIKKNIEKLSEDEQDLKNETGKLDKEDKGDFNNLSKKQSSIKKDLSNNIEDLMNLSKEGMQITPDLGKELGGAFNNMNKSEGSLQGGEKNPAMSNQGKAIESLDRAAKMLGDMLDRMGKTPGKGNKGDGRMGELMQRLAQMISMQQGVNGQMNKMGQNGQTGKDGKGGQEELSQMQKQQLDKLRLDQYQIQKSLEELNSEFEKEKQKTGEKMLGDLKEVEKEMQESIRQMSEYNVDTKLFERQNRILSRMLDAQLSQREKDYEQKRESKPGENVIRKSPQETVISGPRTENALKEDLLRLEKNSYSPDYEALIIEYNKIIKNK